MEGWKWMPSDSDSGFILLHAYTGNPDNLTALGRQLNRLGMDVLLPLLPGHGTQEPRDLLQPSFSAYRTCVDEAYRALREKGKQWIGIGGLSLGGLLSLDAAARLDLQACVSMAAPLGKASLKMAGLVAYFQQYAHQKACFNLDDEEISNYLEQIVRNEEDLLAQLSTVTCPVFMAQGGQDELVNSLEVKRMVQRLKAGRIPIQWHWYPDSPHILTAGPDRLIMREAIGQFLSDIKKGGSNETTRR